MISCTFWGKQGKAMCSIVGKRNDKFQLFSHLLPFRANANTKYTREFLQARKCFSIFMPGTDRRRFCLELLLTLICLIPNFF